MLNARIKHNDIPPADQAKLLIDRYTEINPKEAISMAIDFAETMAVYALPIICDNGMPYWVNVAQGLKNKIA